MNLLTASRWPDNTTVFHLGPGIRPATPITARDLQDSLDFISKTLREYFLAKPGFYLVPHAVANHLFPPPASLINPPNLPVSAPVLADILPTIPNSTRCDINMLYKTASGYIRVTWSPTQGFNYAPTATHAFCCALVPILVTAD